MKGAGGRLRPNLLILATKPAGTDLLQMSHTLEEFDGVRVGL